MKKKYVLIFFCLLFLVGCENQEEKIKNEYIGMKSTLLEEDYTDIDKDNLPLDIKVQIDRVDEEKVKYHVIFSNPKENMNEIKAMVVHNYYSETLFPSVGVFDDKQNLLVSDGDSIELVDTIKTTKNISKLNLELKVWMEYVDDDGEKKEVYYKTT